MNERAEKILRLMEEKGMSYGTLAKQTNISKSALQRYVTGETTKIPIDRLERIAWALDVSSSYLMGWSLGGSHENPLDSAIIQEMLALMQDLPEPLQLIALEQLQCLAKLKLPLPSGPEPNP